MAERKIIYKGRVFELTRNKVRLPGGYTTEIDFIEHKGAVLIVPFLASDRIVLIRQYRPVIRSYIWELPAGTLKSGEKHLLCAKRELIEETGYSASKLLRLGYIYPAPGYTDEKIIIYKAQGLKKVPMQKEEDEIITVKVLSKAQVKSIFIKGGIVDAKTICALKFAKII